MQNRLSNGAVLFYPKEKAATHIHNARGLESARIALLFPVRERELQLKLNRRGSERRRGCW